MLIVIIFASYIERLQFLRWLLAFQCYHVVLDPPTVSAVVPKAFSSELDLVITMFDKGFTSLPTISAACVTNSSKKL